jgi:3',5'-cyclic AMP phosphodiesterase CpdA
VLSLNDDLEPEMLIAQLSDLHVCAPGTLYRGLVDSNSMLADAVSALDRFDTRPDLVIISGDITEHGTADEYAEARRLLAGIAAPVIAIPGNHDEREAFRTAFAVAGTGPLHVVRDDLGPVRLIGLDVTVPGLHHGDFDATAETWLSARLAEAPERPTLIAMHQPPFDSGIGFIDPYRCFGEGRLAALLAQHPQVQRVVCGHVHRAMTTTLGGRIVSMAPATCSSIALRLAPGAEPASFIEPPGFLLHHWDGRAMVTHHAPIGQFRGPLPFF